MMQIEHPYREMVLNTKQLEVPRDTYQRKLQPARVKEIVGKFDERLLNDPKVSCRNGHFYVFDGQHTIAACKRRNNNHDLPIKCKVYYGLTESDEALLFAEQTGASAPLTAGAKIRAKVYGGDPEAIAFVRATEKAGFSIDYDQGRGKKRIGCVATALDQYRKVGEAHYREGLMIILAAWGGDPESLRSENISGIIQFVDLYHDDYDPRRLAKRFSQVDPLTIYREGRSLGVSLPGVKKYIYQVLKIYNGTSKIYKLPVKF